MALVKVRGFPTADGPLDIHVDEGERVRIVGPNGSGKTSLLRAIAGLPGGLSPKRARLHDSDPTTLPANSLANQLAFVQQDPRDTLIGLTVAAEHRFRGLPPVDDDQEVATLSSGEARRVALAVSHAPLLLLDEPIEGLDADGLRLLRDRIEAQDTVVFVDHDGRLADLATRTVRLGEQPTPPHTPMPAVSGAAWTRSEAQVRDIHLPAVALEPGLHALVGPNGCGKTTCLRHWSGIGGDPNPDVAWMGPRARDLLAADAVGDLLDAEARDILGLDILERHPMTLSGGEMQRVALAMTFARDRRILLLDEPEAHLDAAGRAWMLEHIAAAIQAGKIVVVATHDPSVIAAAHSTVVMP